MRSSEIQKIIAQAAYALCAIFSLPTYASDFYRLTFIAESPLTIGTDWHLLPAPGGQVTINNDGVVAYVATRLVTGGQETAVFIGDGQSQTMIATGTIQSGIALHSPAINNSGDVAYVVGSTVNIWSKSVGTSSVLFPCTPPLNCGNISTFSDVGQTAVRLLSAGNPFAIVAPTSGAIVAQGLLSETNFGNLPPVISRNGSNAAWYGGAGGVTNSVVVINPSLTSRFAFSPALVVQGLSINNLANTAFVSQGSAGTSLRGIVGVISTQAGSSGLIRVADDDPNGQFINFSESPSIDNLNQVAFVGQARANGAGISLPYLGDVSGRPTTPIALADEPIADDGTTLASVAQGGFGPQSMNDKGQIAFYALIQRPGTGPTSGNRIAVLRADPASGVSATDPVVPSAADALPGGGWRLQACSNALWSKVPVLSCPPIQYIDPVLATGYVYTVEAPGSNFKTVLIPAPLANGDATFQVEFEGHTAPLLAGQAFDFTSVIPGGVQTFRITGIDTAEALDPANGRAFVTGLSYVNPSVTNFTVTMVPIVENPDDTDLDGVPNAIDICPNTAPGAAVDAVGCSAQQRDTDHDGVPDSADACPGTPPNSQVDAAGCSASQRDSDGDGVADSVDACPGTAPNSAVDAAGCSASQRDTDHDGVVDSADLCPGTPAGSAVNAAGCSLAQLDSDKDGVNDNIDACPGTPAGTPVDATGCPVVTQGHVCDVNNDGHIDYKDIASILLSVGKKATGPTDPKDANHNGKIELLDVTACTAKCDRRYCF